MVKRWINGKVKFMILFFVCGISTYSNSLTDEQKKSIHEEVIKYLESNKIKLGKGEGLAIGEKSFAEDDGDMVIGKSARSRGNGLSYSIAIGYNAFTLGSETKKGIGGQATAIGAYTFASSYALALGDGSNAYGDSSVALGGANISGQDSYGIGGRNHNSGDFSTSIGYNSMTTTDHSIVMGDDTVSHYGKDLKDGFVDDKTYKKEYQEMFNKIMAEEGEKIKKKYKDAGYTDEQIEKMYIGIEVGQLATRELSKKYTKYNENGSGSGYFKKDKRAGANVVIGSNSKAFGSFNTVLGAFSEVYGEYNIALGVASKIENSSYSMAIGDFSKVVNSSKGVALGYGASVTKEGAIALGENSVADKDKGQLGYGVTKEITSIDEILKMTDKKEEYEKNKKIIANKKDEYNAMITKYENTSTKDEKAKIEKEKKEWLDNNKDFIPAVKANRDIISIWKSTAGALSIGQTGYTRQLTNLAAGTNDTDAVNVAQLKQMKSYVDREVSTKVGKSAYEIWKESDVKNKDKSVQDFLASLKGEKGAKGDGESAYQSWLKQKGNEGKSESEFVKSLKGEKGDSAYMTWKNLDENKNKKQKELTEEKFINSLKGKDGKDGKSAFEVWKDKNKKPDATEDEFFKAITKGASLSSKEKEQMNKRIDDANEKSDLALGGVSNAIAMANLPQVMGNRKFNLSASYGYYGKSHSLAIGFSGVNSKGNFIYKLSGAVNNQGNLGLGAGFGIMLGEINTSTDENIKKELKVLKEERKQDKKVIENLRKQVDELYKMLKR